MPELLKREIGKALRLTRDRPPQYQEQIWFVYFWLHQNNMGIDNIERCPVQIDYRLANSDIC